MLLLLFIHFRQRNTIESCLLQKPKMWKKSFLCNKKNEFSLDVLSTCFHWRNHLQNNTQQLNYICSSSSFRQWTWGILGQFSIPNYDGRVVFSISPTWPKNLSAILDTMWKASKKLIPVLSTIVVAFQYFALEKIFFTYRIQRKGLLSLSTKKFKSLAANDWPFT